jgi:hypothetical protein
MDLGERPKPIAKVRALKNVAGSAPDAKSS